MYSKLKTSIIALTIICMTGAIITFPNESLRASIHALHTWWEIVFPSLLPFFIMAELLISFGIVQFFGVLFEPIMRPLFNVPGAGSFAFVLGMVSGFPSGAKITVLLRENKSLSQIEAERLIAFSNAASPIFIFGAIAIGFFNHVQLGFIIAFSHYASNILVGLAMKYYRYQPRPDTKDKRRTSFIRKAFHSMHQTRIKEERPFGEIIGDAVISSIQTLLVIGGFIILFSVCTSLLQVVRLTDLLTIGLQPILSLLHIPSDVIPAMVTGFFEITIGAEVVSQTEQVSLLGQLILISFLLAFNGLSIQAQVASLIAKSDIRFAPYFFARFAHALIASLLTYLCYKLYFRNKLDFIDTFHQTSSLSKLVYHYLEGMAQIGPVLTIASILIAFIYLCKKQLT